MRSKTGKIKDFCSSGCFFQSITISGGPRHCSSLRQREGGSTYFGTRSSLCLDCLLHHFFYAFTTDRTKLIASGSTVTNYKALSGALKSPRAPAPSPFQSQRKPSRSFLQQHPSPHTKGQAQPRGASSTQVHTQDQKLSLQQLGTHHNTPQSLHVQEINGKLSFLVQKGASSVNQRSRNSPR